MSAISLSGSLQGLRKRQLALGALGGVWWAAALGAAALLAGMWLDLVLELSGIIRLLWGVLAIAGGLALLAALVRSGAQRASAGALSKRLDDVAQARGQIVAGVDLHLRPRSGDLTVTAGMAQIAMDRASALAAAVSPSRAIPAGPLKWPALAAGALAAVVALIALLAPRLAATQFSRFIDPFGEHPPYSNLVFHVEPGDTRIVYGTALDVRVTTSGEPVDRVDLVLHLDAQADEVLPMFAEPGGQWRATVTNVVTAGKYSVRAARARSQRFKIDLVTVPRIERVRFQITPPKYTNLDPYEGPLPQGGIAGLAGTLVEVIATSNRPLSGGDLRLVLEGGEEQAKACTPRGESEVVGTFTIDRPGKMHLRVVDVAGQASTDSFSASITILSDERPFVRILQPMETSLATPTSVIPIELDVEDDYGISRVQLYRSLNDSRATALELPVPTPAQTRPPVGHRLPLEGYGLKPGDEVKLFARVEDNDPAGAKGSESTVVTIRIISEEEYQQLTLEREGLEVLEAKYAEANRRLEAIKDELRKLHEELAGLDANDPLAEEKRQEIAELAREMKEAARAIRELAKKELPFDLDKALNDELGKLAAELDDVAEKAQELAKQPKMDNGMAAAGLEKLLKQLGEADEAFDEEVMEPLELLAQVFPLIEDQTKFVEIYERQRDLEQRLQPLKDVNGGDDPQGKARMRDLEAEQRALRHALDDLLDDIERHAAELPADPQLDELRQSAEEFAKAVRESGASEQMSNGEMGLADFSGERGYNGAKEAAEILERFIERGGAMGNQAGQCLVFQPKLAEGLGDTIGQLLGKKGMGQGAGMGGRGGLARRSSLRNVGLYGSLPRASQYSRGGSGRSERFARGGGPTDRHNDPGNPGSVSAREQARTAGQADAAVPAIYKRRVGDYFQRVAEELGQ